VLVNWSRFTETPNQFDPIWRSFAAAVFSVCRLTSIDSEGYLAWVIKTAHSDGYSWSEKSPPNPMMAVRDLLTSRNTEYGQQVIDHMGYWYLMPNIMGKAHRAKHYWRTNREIHWDSLIDIVGYIVLMAKMDNGIGLESWVRQSVLKGMSDA